MEFTHTDNDGDTLRVVLGGQSIVFTAHDREEGDRAEVALGYDATADLIASLQAMLPELG